MNGIEILFWSSIAVVFYTYLGYGLIVWVLGKFTRSVDHPELDENDLPEITHIIAAYNEEDIIEEKIQNCLQMEFPVSKLKTVVVTDGSTDGTMDIVRKFPEIDLYHEDGRAGKLAAVNRVIADVKTPIIVFSDANAMINPLGIQKMAVHFQNNRVGAVAGEKVVLSEEADDAASAGEGLYWKYESFLKQQDYKVHSVVGAAGELFAVRTHLYKAPKSDLLIEDFITTMEIAAEGYRVAYEPMARASETASVSVAQEIKRKVRISAGGLQAVHHLATRINPWNNFTLLFQYLSHRALRWTLAPLGLLVAFIANINLSINGSFIYDFLMGSQLLFYTLAALGYLFERKKVRVKALFVPFYFAFMNLSVYMGAFQLLFGELSVTWEKASRK